MSEVAIRDAALRRLVMVRERTMPAPRCFSIATPAPYPLLSPPPRSRRSSVPDDTPHDPLESETMRGFNVLLGYRLAEWRDDFARLELVLEPKHLNRSGVVHGGVLATMLDVTLGYAGVFTAEPGRVRRAVTLSMTTSFLG